MQYTISKRVSLKAIDIANGGSWLARPVYIECHEGLSQALQGNARINEE
jgi:hypothetical protein